MKLQNILRMQAIVIGLGATLLLASSAPAQEIVNTEFPDGPNVAAFAQPAPAATVNDSDAAVVLIPSVMSPAAASIATPVPAQAAAISLWYSVQGWVIASLLLCIGLVALYALAEAKRANRNLDARTGSQGYRRVALS